MEHESTASEGHRTIFIATGAYGCLLADTSPDIDAFAKQALRFNHAHVQVGNCMPGRNIMWSGMYSHVNGERKFATATTGTMTNRQIVKRAAREPDIAARLELFDHRVLEELYDIANDPNSLVHRIDDPQCQSAAVKLRQQLAQSLAEMKDPVAPLVADVENRLIREDYMRREDARAESAKAARRRQRSNN